MLPQKDGSKSAFCKPKSPKKPTTKIFTIRPYRQGDRVSSVLSTNSLAPFDNVCTYTCPTGGM